MSVTISLVDNQSIEVTEETVDVQSPGHITFVVEGVITMTANLLGTFEGTTLKPAHVGLAVDESRTVEVDLSECALRLEAVDVGVETPGSGAVSPEEGSIFPSSGEETGAADGGAGAIAFTVEGVIQGVPSETLEAISGGAASVTSVSFAVTDTVQSDGGSADDVVLEVSLLGYGVVVRRDGTIEIGVLGGETDVGLL